MTLRWRVGAVGLGADRARAQLAQWAAHPFVEVAAAADPDPDILNVARTHAVAERFYESWEEMLIREDLHFLQVYTDMAIQPNIIEAAACRGIHCLTQGPGAASVDGAERILSAARQHHVQVMIDWPAAWNPAIFHAMEMAQNEAIGVLCQAWRRASRPTASHPGERPVPDASSRCAAGNPHGQTKPSSLQAAAEAVDAERECERILLNTCAEGVALCHTLLGMPSSVTAVAAAGSPRVPGATGIMTLTLGYTTTLACVEGIQAQSYLDASPDFCLRGSSGSLCVQGQDLWLYGEATPRGARLDARPLPEGEESAPEQLILAGVRNQDLTGFCSPGVARDAREILEAASLSIRAGRTISMPIR